VNSNKLRREVTKVIVYPTMIDLHTHSYYSDGALSPKELVILAKKQGVQALALTDHDTVDGLPEFLEAVKEHHLAAVGGIEFSTDFVGEDMHLLGYGIDHTYEPILQYLQRKKDFNYNRVKAIVRKLNQNGFNLDFEQMSQDSTNLKRVHAVKQIVFTPVYRERLQQLTKMENPTFNDAFPILVGKKGIAFVPGNKSDPQEVVELIHHAGGVAVVAHPGLRKGNFSEQVIALQHMGMDGIECYYPEHTPQQQELFIQQAQEAGMLITGGTDFHGGGVHPGINIGRGSGDFHVKIELFHSLVKKIKDSKTLYLP